VKGIAPGDPWRELTDVFLSIAGGKVVSSRKRMDRVPAK